MLLFRECSRWKSTAKMRRADKKWTIQVILQRLTGLKTTKPTFQNVLKTLAERKRSDLILEAFALLRNRGFAINERDFTVGILACGRSKLWQDAC